MHIYYVYIHTHTDRQRHTHTLYAVKISAQTSLKVLNIFNAGAGLVLVTLITTAASVSFIFDNNCVYIDTECLYDHIKRETFPIRTPLCLSASMKTVQVMRELQ